MEASEGATALEQFCLLAKGATGRAVVGIVQQTLNSKKVYVFGELLAVPAHGETAPMPPTRYDALPMQQIGRAEQDDLFDPTRSPLFALVGASEAVLSAVSWAACSIGMTLLNKVSVNKSGSPYGVVLVQMGVTCVAAVATRDLRFGEGTRRWAVSVPALFVVMMVTSMLALQV